MAVCESLSFRALPLSLSVSPSLCVSLSLFASSARFITDTVFLLFPDTALNSPVRPLMLVRVCFSLALIFTLSIVAFLSFSFYSQISFRRCCYVYNRYKFDSSLKTRKTHL